MPNWCNNTLRVIGEHDQLIAFIEQGGKRPPYYQMLDYGKKDTGFCFSGFVPVPEKELLSGDVRSWGINNWGTKWDVNVDNIEDQGDSIILYFDTAWSPPKHWFRAVSAMYPDLEFRLDYIEYGMQFAGSFVAQEGIVLIDEERNVTDEEIAEAFGE
jgi:hypothetical protein